MVGASATRRVLSIVLYGLGAAGALLCGLTALAIRQNLQHNAATGDFTGAALGRLFLVGIFLPFTLAMFLAAILAWPPRWLRWLIERPVELVSRGEVEGGSAGALRVGVVAALAVVGIASLAAALWVLVTTGRNETGGHSVALAYLLFYLWPLILLGGLCFLAALRLIRAGSARSRSLRSQA